MFRVNGKTLTTARESICTVEEMISGEVWKELKQWQYFMIQFLSNDISTVEVIRHDWYKRHKGAFRKRGGE